MQAEEEGEGGGEGGGEASGSQESRTAQIRRILETPQEFDEMLSRVFADADADGNGSVDAQEFAALLRDFYKQTHASFDHMPNDKEIRES